MGNSQPDRHDRLLDRELAAYVGQSPRPGLEARVLSRIRAEAERSGWSIKHWASLVAVACLLAGFAIWQRRVPATAPVKIIVSGANAGPAVARVLERSQMPDRASKRRPAATLRHAGFPHPPSLTRQERALVAFARRDPGGALRMAPETQPIEIEPLRIQEIQVQPLPDEP